MDGRGRFMVHLLWLGLLAENAMEGEIRARVGCLVRQLSARSLPLLDHWTFIRGICNENYYRVALALFI